MTTIEASQNESHARAYWTAVWEALTEPGQMRVYMYEDMYEDGEFCVAQVSPNTEKCVDCGGVGDWSDYGDGTQGMTEDEFVQMCWECFPEATIPAP